MHVSDFWGQSPLPVPAAGRAPAVRTRWPALEHLLDERQVADSGAADWEHLLGPAGPPATSRQREGRVRRLRARTRATVLVALLGLAAGAAAAWNVLGTAVVSAGHEVAATPGVG